MRTISSIAAALIVTTSATPVLAQYISTQIDRAPDGRIRLSFETRPEICGDGRSIGEETADGLVLYTFEHYGYSVNTYEDWLPNCERGPLLLVVTKRGGRVVDLAAAVGAEWRPTTRALGLGLVGSAEAANWLLDIAEVSDDDIGRIAFFAANAAANTQIADRLIDMSVDRGLEGKVRERAMRWVNGAAGREGKGDAADAMLRDVAESVGERHNIRERAIRVLRTTAANDAFLRGLYGDLGNRELKERVIRRLGKSASSVNVQWITTIATTNGESITLRERALRVIGGELDRPDDVRNLFDRLDHPALKERALKVVAEHGGGSENLWLREVAADRSEPIDVRERAVRLLAERASADDLFDLFRELNAVQLRERVIRMAGEKRVPGTTDWLRSVALDGSEHKDVRERAVRVLCEWNETEARQLYSRLESVQLKERALRLAGERRDDETENWLMEVAVDNNERSQLRDRAIRLIGEGPRGSEVLVGLYDQLDRRDLRQRVVRLLAERGDRSAIEKLRSIAQSDPSREMRRYAARRLADVANP